ncbi:hypothetical protein ACFLU5_17130 [Bacteroidota bacterium]
MKILKSILILIAAAIFGVSVNAQGIKLGEVVLVSTSSIKTDIDTEAFKSFMMEETGPAWNASLPGTAMYLLQADRGNRNGEFLTVCIAETIKDRKKLHPGSPFTDKTFSMVSSNLSGRPSDFLEKPHAYTEYQLIGSDQFTSLPKVEILGIHYIKVKADRDKEFEKLVVNKLHPAVGNLVHDMNLFYYKAVAGKNKGSYITIYAIESVTARERFWPTGGPEQDIVKQLFGPNKELAIELESYLVEDSYLGPESGGGAAYFESLEWTDYVIIDNK